MQGDAPSWPMDALTMTPNPIPSVALCNYRYFLSGGPERYMFAVEHLLQRHGHKVAPFAARYPQNRETPFSRYFVSPPVRGGTVYFEDHSRSLRNLVSLVWRCFYSFEAKHKLKQLIRAESLDVAYILQHHNVLSPSIISATKELGRKVVVRLSDFSLLCPAYHFLKHGRPCEACYGGLWHALPGRCSKGSLGATLARVASMYFHRLLRVYEQVDAFVTPTQFLREKMIRGAFPADRIHHIPTFVDAPTVDKKGGTQRHILYLGRLSPEKGVEHLLRAYGMLRHRQVPLVIVGDGLPTEVARLQALATTLGLQGVQFLGFKSGDEAVQLLQECFFLVVPSICYENLPNVVLEAFVQAKPVIASRIGSLPEVVTDGVEGLLFEAADAKDLSAKMDALLSAPKRARELGEHAADAAATRFSPTEHYRRLIEVLR
jgi:glycosyltransferase involved in cell wall biosynthesis